jgi:glycosyltransferase involved in cell wall biosynthesis
MRLVVDGVFFQLAHTGIARVWSSILPRLANYSSLKIALLDRGNCPSIKGIEKVDFPSYKLHANSAADSFLIEKYCTELDADVFLSTYYTTPVSTPAVLVVYDMIPEVLGFNLSDRAWQEKAIAVAFASYCVCISENTRSDLNCLYPSTLGRSIVTQCGVEREIFRPCDHSRLQNFKRQFGIAKPYFVLVGSREQGHGYKNAKLVFDAAREMRDFEFEIVCVGGEQVIDPDSLVRLPTNVSARRLDLTDEELACAYSGAEALVFPSLYEGFGLPVIEAMACGCPVVTTKNGALAEISGDAAIFVSGRDEDELRRAMSSVRTPSHRKQLVERGLRRAALYDWDVMARGLHGSFKKAQEDGETSAMKDFFDRWKKLRRIQAEVEVES